MAAAPSSSFQNFDNSALIMFSPLGLMDESLAVKAEPNPRGTRWVGRTSRGFGPCSGAFATRRGSV